MPGKCRNRKIVRSSGLAHSVLDFFVTQTQDRNGKRPRSHAPRAFAAALAILLCASACANGTASGTGAAVSRSTPGAALTDWLRQVVRGDYRAACHDTATTPASAPTSARGCASWSRLMHSLHENFTVDRITPQSPITIVAAHVRGTSATISGTRIRVSGTTLTSLMIKHSTGVNPSQFSISFPLSRVRGAWYVAGLKMNIGGNVPFKV
jgi:hypothetical protein